MRILIFKYKFIFFIVFSMFLSIMVCKGQEESLDNPAPRKTQEELWLTKKLKQIFGDSVINIINNADTIEAYHLNWKRLDTTKNGFQNYQVLKKIPVLTKNQSDSLIKIIANEKSFICSKWSKLCEFNPEFGYRFINGKKNLIVLVALDCDILRFVQSNKNVKMDIDPAHNEFLSLKNMLFRQVQPVVSRRQDSTNNDRNDTIQQQTQQNNEQDNVPRGQENDTDFDDEY